MVLALLLACGRPEPPGPPPLPTSLPLHDWDDHLHLADDEWPPWPPHAVATLKGEPQQLGDHTVLLGASLDVDAPGCTSWNLPPLLLGRRTFASARSLDPIDQRLDITLDAAESLVRVERMIDTPLDAPSLAHWPATWTLEATVDGAYVELPREGDVVAWPAAQRLTMAGDGRLPQPNWLDEQGLTLAIGDLVPDRRARTTGVALIGSPFHFEPGRGLRFQGSEAFVAGVRFPHHASRDGIRVLANDDSAEALLERLLSLRATSPFPWPRPLFVVPGGRDQHVGDHLALGLGARTDEAMLARAAWHLHPMDDALRRTFQRMEQDPATLEDPGCFGLRSRPEADRSRLLAQVLLRDPEAHTAGSWAELEARRPWLTAWLDAPRWPLLTPIVQGDAIRWLDTRDTGLDLRIPVLVGDAPHIVAVGEAIAGLSPAQVRIDPAARLPAFSP